MVLKIFICEQWEVPFTSVHFVMNPIRVTKKQACGLLSIKADTLVCLVKNDPTFPKPYKTGTTRQAPVYFDYAALVEWHKQQLSNSAAVEA